MFFGRKRRLWSKAKAALDAGNFHGFQALFPAAKWEQLDPVKMSHLLHWAVDCGDVDLLSGIVAEPGIRDSVFLRDNLLLGYAIERGEEQAVKLLAEAHVSHHGGPTPLPFMLHKSCWVLNQEIAQIMLDFGCDINALGEHSETPLMATFFGYDLTPGVGISRLVQMVEFLTANGADPNISNNKNFGTMHCAARVGDLSLIRSLVSFGGEIDPVSENHVTPLVIAAEGGHARAVRFFIAQGAMVDFRFDEGHTLLDLCLNRGRHDVAQIVQEALESGS